MVHTHLKAATIALGNTARYAPVHTNFSVFGTSATTQRQPMPIGGTFRNLRVELTAALVGADTRTIALMVNGSDSALTVTLTSASTVATLTGTDVTVNAGDLVQWHSTAADNPAASTLSISVDFEASSGSNVSVYATGGGDLFSGATGDSLLYSDGNWGTYPGSIAATPGTITRWDALLSAAPGVGNGFVFVIEKNGVNQDGTAGTPDTRITFGSADTQLSASFSLSVASGDLLRAVISVTGSPAVTGACAACAFSATSANRWNVGMVSTNGPSNSATRYAYHHATGVTVMDATEANKTMDGPQTTFWLSGFRVRSTNAPTAGRSWTVTLRKNASNTASEVVISDAETSDADHDDRVEVTSADQVSVGVVPAGTPVNTVLSWAFVASTTDPGAGEGGSGGSIPVFMNHYRNQGMI